jgi:hypothetical protein
MWEGTKQKKKTLLDMMRGESFEGVTWKRMTSTRSKVLRRGQTKLSKPLLKMD